MRQRLIGLIIFAIALVNGLNNKIRQHLKINCRAKLKITIEI